MTEFNETPMTAEASEPAAAPALSAGGMLRQARERAGVHLGMLSVALKVSVSQLMALESDDHAQLSGPVFVRALAGSVCRQLKIDAAPVLALLPPTSQRLTPMPEALESSRPEFFGRQSQRRWAVNRKMVWMVMVMLALIALILWLPEWPTRSAAIEAPVPQVVVAEPAASGNPMVVLLPSESVAESVPGATAAATPKAAAAAVQPLTAGAALEIIFKGRADAWIEVKDAVGTVVFSKLVKAGETHVVKGVPVLTVLIGAADAVDVLVRGQALDLTPFSRGAVARFEVK